MEWDSKAEAHGNVSGKLLLLGSYSPCESSKVLEVGLEPTVVSIMNSQEDGKGPLMESDCQRRKA